MITTVQCSSSNVWAVANITHTSSLGVWSENILGYQGKHTPPLFSSCSVLSKSHKKKLVIIFPVLFKFISLKWRSQEEIGCHISAISFKSHICSKHWFSWLSRLFCHLMWHVLIFIVQLFKLFTCQVHLSLFSLALFLLCVAR